MKFNFQARTKEGELQKGVVEATSKEAALALLQKAGLYVTSLEEKPLPFYARKITLFERVSKKELVLFSRQLAIMFKAKVPLVEALDTLALQIKKEKFREEIFKIREEIEGGSSVSLTFSHHPELFSPFFVAMVKSGEASGKLSESLEYLANHLEREYEFSGKLLGALLYPAFIFLISLTIASLMVIFVLPQLTSILKESGQPLPAITVFIMGVVDFLREYGLLFLLSFVGILVFIFWAIKTPEGKKIYDHLSLRIPVLGEFLKKIYLVRIAENLSTLISAGLPIARALEVTGEVAGNDVYKNIMLKAQAGVKRGESISAILNAYPESFPPLFTQMTLVGEKTGTLATSLLHLVDFYQKEVERALRSFLSLLEPLLIVLLGIAVAIFAVAFLTPIYQMMGRM